VITGCAEDSKAPTDADRAAPSWLIGTSSAAVMELAAGNCDIVGIYDSDLEKTSWLINAYAATTVPAQEEIHCHPSKNTSTPLPMPAASPGFRPFDAKALAPAGMPEGNLATL
jgi:hypothetical protein